MSYIVSDTGAELSDLPIVLIEDLISGQWDSLNPTAIGAPAASLIDFNYDIDTVGRSKRHLLKIRELETLADEMDIPGRNDRYAGFYEIKMATKDTTAKLRPPEDHRKMRIYLERLIKLKRRALEPSGIKDIQKINIGDNTALVDKDREWWIYVINIGIIYFMSDTSP